MIEATTNGNAETTRKESRSDPLLLFQELLEMLAKRN